MEDRARVNTDSTLPVQRSYLIQFDGHKQLAFIRTCCLKMHLRVASLPIAVSGLTPLLYSKKFAQYLLHRILRHMYGVRRRKKTNCTVG